MFFCLYTAPDHWPDTPGIWVSLCIGDPLGLVPNMRVGPQRSTGPLYSRVRHMGPRPLQYLINVLQNCSNQYRLWLSSDIRNQSWIYSPFGKHLVPKLLGSFLPSSFYLQSIRIQWHNLTLSLSLSLRPAAPKNGRTPIDQLNSKTADTGVGIQSARIRTS